VRRTLALVCAAVTSMVALAFLIPLALLVRQIAQDNALRSAQFQAASIEPVLAVTTSRAGLSRAVDAAQSGGDARLAVYLTGPAGNGSVLAAGSGRADPADLARAVASARSFTVSRPGGYVEFQPVALGGGRLAVIEAFVPGADLTRGVAVSWAVMAALAVALVAVSVVLADRLAAQVTGAARRLATAAAALGGGDLASSAPSASAPSAADPAPTPTVTPSPSPSPSPSSPAPSTSPSQPAASTAGFAPYVDTSLFPPFSLTSVAAETGVKQFNLAFVVSGGGCTPEWGGTTAIGENPVAAEISALRAMGGDVRVSFGGEDGSELAQTCTSAPQLASAYQQVISAYDLNKIDFDIEGAALDDTAANAVRDQALAQLQAQDPGLQVSFTLPVEPSGLTQDGIDLLDGAVSAGVSIAAVNVMAMDYGDADAPDPATMMGTYAIDAATATDAQIAGALGISDAAAWARVAVTPMIGQNDQADEVFTVADAQQLEAFAAAKHLAWLSMWSAGRDTECPGDVDTAAQPTCSGIVQTPQEFMETLGQY